MSPCPSKVPTGPNPPADSWPAAKGPIGPAIANAASPIRIERRNMSDAPLGPAREGRNERSRAARIIPWPDRR